MVNSFKIDNVYSDNIGKISRLHYNQFQIAYQFNTKNELYKQLQKKLYKLGYDVEINGDFSRYNMYSPMCEYSRDKYNTVYDVDGVSYYSLYNLLFDIESKIKCETEIFNLSGIADDVESNNYSLYKNTGDFVDDVVFKNKIIILNPMDEFGETVIKYLIPMLNYYKTNYIEVKQYSLNESMRDRVGRIKDYIDRTPHIQPFILNIGNAIDYVNPTIPTLLRGINLYHNQGAVFGDYRKIDIYSRYMSAKFNYYLKEYFEYVRLEKTNRLPLLKYFNDLGNIPTFQLEIGYINNPIDKIILKNNNIMSIITNSICHTIQRIISLKLTQRYTDLNMNDTIDN